MSHQHPVDDLSELPTSGFGSSSPVWWGTLSFIALEGTGFALAAGSYFYLRQVNTQWPLSAPPPGALGGTAMLLLLLVSLWPNAMAASAARKQQLGSVQLWLIVMSAIGLLTLGVRAWEFVELNIRWDT